MALTFDHVQSDTIAAIATAISESGIGIVRISGPEAIEIAAKVYRNKKRRQYSGVLEDQYHSLWLHCGSKGK